MKDERLNVPSASAIARIQLCPGSRRMEVANPDKRTKDASIGDEAHDLAALFFRSSRPDSQPDTREFDLALAAAPLDIVDVVGRFIEMVKSVWNDWILESFDDGARPVTYIEERLVWLDDKCRPITTGKPDLLFVSGHRALIPDLKSLYGEQVESVKNLQLRTYAVLANEEYGVTDVTVAICQPRISSTPQLCRYQDNDLVLAREEIRRALTASESPDAPLVAGIQQCKFCNARAVCPAAHKFAAIEPVAPPRPLARGEAAKIVESVSVIERFRLREKAKTIKAILEAVDDNLKELPAAELAEYGWEILTERGDRTILDGAAAGEIFKEFLTPAQWNGCCSVGISKLEAVFRAATNLPVKETRTRIEELLGELLGRKADKRVLSRIKRDAKALPATEQLTLATTTTQQQ